MNRFAAILMAAAGVLPSAGWCGSDEDRSDMQVLPSMDPASKRVDLLEVDISGNSVLDAKTIYAVVHPFLGPGKTLDDVDLMRAELEKTYQDRGYRTVSVVIPKQTTRAGVVQLEVVENRVGRLDVLGSKYHSLERIKSLSSSVAPGTVPDFDQFQADLVRLSGVPNLRVTPALKAGTRSNTVDIDLVVDDSLPLSATFEVNNRHGQDTAPLRTQVGLSYSDLWQHSHNVSFAYQVAPQEPEQSAVFFGSYLFRFESSSTSALVSYVHSDSSISTIGGVTVLGKGEIVGLRSFIPLEGTADVFPTATLGIDYKKFRNSTGLPDTGQGARTFETPVTYYPLTAGVGWLWRQTQATTQSDLTLTFASSQFGSDGAELDNSRYAVRGEQFSLRGSVSRTDELPLALQSGVRLSWQLTNQPLITTEQFSVGGADTVRGYLESAALGDRGSCESVELRSPPLGYRFLHLDARIFGFYDDASVNLVNTLPEERSSFRLSSWGFGARLRVYAVDIAVTSAYPLRDPPSGSRESNRVLFRMAGVF